MSILGVFQALQQYAQGLEEEHEDASPEIKEQVG